MVSVRRRDSDSSSARRTLSALSPGRSGLVDTFVARTMRSRTGREDSQFPMTVSDSPPELPGAQYEYPSAVSTRFPPASR